MRASELAMSMAAMQENLNLTIASEFAKLSNTFEAIEGTTNAEAEEGAYKDLPDEVNRLAITMNSGA